MYITSIQQDHYPCPPSPLPFSIPPCSPANFFLNISLSCETKSSQRAGIACLLSEPGGSTTSQNDSTALDHMTHSLTTNCGEYAHMSFLFSSLQQETATAATLNTCASFYSQDHQENLFFFSWTLFLFHFIWAASDRQEEQMAVEGRQKGEGRVRGSGVDHMAMTKIYIYIYTHTKRDTLFTNNQTDGQINPTRQSERQRNGRDSIITYDYRESALFYCQERQDPRPPAANSFTKQQSSLPINRVIVSESGQQQTSNQQQSTLNRWNVHQKNTNHIIKTTNKQTNNKALDASKGTITFNSLFLFFSRS